LGSRGEKAEAEDRTKLAKESIRGRVNEKVDGNRRGGKARQARQGKQGKQVGQGRQGRQARQARQARQMGKQGQQETAF
jgi:hypothetical protein